MVVIKIVGRATTIILDLLEAAESAQCSIEISLRSKRNKDKFIGNSVIQDSL